MSILNKIIQLLPNFDNIKLIFANMEELTIFSICYDVLKICEQKDDADDVTQTLGLATQENFIKIDECIWLITALKDKLWEAINTGIWQNVSDEIRQAFTFSNFLLIALRVLKQQVFNDGDLSKNDPYIYDLDYSFLLGSPINGYETLIDDTMNVLNSKEIIYENIAHKTISAHKARPQQELIIPNVEILNQPSLELFKKKHFKPRTPAILLNCISEWPALEKWNKSGYLINKIGNRFVPVEIGKHYLNDNWSQDIIQLKDFIYRNIENSSNISEENIQYLAQHNLFDQITELKRDILIPEYCFLTEKSRITSNAPDVKVWLGPKGTISPMHQDPKHNLLCQVFGYKKIILASPLYSEYLYRFDGDMLKNSSQIDAEHLDFDKFPLLRKVKFYEFNLYPGEIIYIPPKWWHYVRSLDTSFSVSFWWD